MQLRLTTPVNPFAAVANTVVEFPLVAPAVTLTDAGVDVIAQLPAVVAPVLPLDVIAAAISFAPSTEPQPVDSSNPVATSNPASPPVSPAEDGVLLLHIEGMLSAQPETPLVDSVTS